ncbi:MAG TPA: hypothetical protein VFW25_12780 [Silvibacterium sp.]|nr:hypothetical protein [Silvibacterium sp.]
MFTAPDYAKDVAIALLGASVGIAGLLLVVAGFVFAQAASFNPDDTDDKIINGFRVAGRLGLVPLVLALADAGVSLFWLVHKSDCTYTVAIWGFFLLLILTGLYGLVLILRYL